MDFTIDQLFQALEQPEIRTLAIFRINAILSQEQLEKELAEAREVGNRLNDENTKNMAQAKELSDEVTALRAFIKENIKDEALLSQIFI